MSDQGSAVGSSADRPDGAVVVGVDVGGTKILAGVVGPDGVACEVAHRDTPGRRVAPELVEDVVDDAVREVAGGRTLAAVGLAAAGLVDEPGEHVVFAPHLPWQGSPLRDRLQQRWGVPVVLDNDASCAAVAEARVGAARAARLAVVVCLGTGIGGAVVVEGRVLRGAGGMGGEFGHVRVRDGGRPCECGGTGCWEQYCSGHALVRYAADAAPERDPVSGPEVTAAARDGAPWACEAVERVGEWLGVGLAALATALDPDLVVIGGGVAAAGDLLLDPAREVLARRILAPGHRAVPRVVPAALGPRAGLVGAALLATERLPLPG